MYPRGERDADPQVAPYHGTPVLRNSRCSEGGLGIYVSSSWQKAFPPPPKVSSCGATDDTDKQI